MSDALPSPELDLSDTSVPRLRVTGTPVPRIDPDELARALGAEAVPTRIEGHPAPITRYALRVAIMGHRRPNDPSPESDRCATLPLSQDDRRQLEEIAAVVAEGDFTPSADQVGSALLALAIHAVRRVPPTNGTHPFAEEICRQIGTAIERPPHALPG